MIEKLKWLGHASFLIDSELKIYIDPYDLKSGLPEADIILITHSHYDHLSVEDIEKIAKNDTVILTPDKKNISTGKIIEVKPNETREIKGIKIETVPAYNIGKSFHPKENNWVGYIVEIEGKRIYHAGDTDFIPEMKEITCDIALLPVGGTYTMDWKEAVEAGRTINTKIVIPMHWGKIVGEKSDALKVKENLKKEVIILQ